MVMDAEQAMALAERLQGPEGVAALEREFQEHIENRIKQITLLQGEIKGVQISLRVIKALKVRWGLVEGTPTPAEAEALKAGKQLPPAGEPETISPEIKARIKARNCTFKNPKAKGGKWCQRKLKTKKEQEYGYCDIHGEEVYGDVWQEMKATVKTRNQTVRG